MMVKQTTNNSLFPRGQQFPLQRLPWSFQRISTNCSLERRAFCFNRFNKSFMIDFLLNDHSSSIKCGSCFRKITAFRKSAPFRKLYPLHDSTAHILGLVGMRNQMSRISPPKSRYNFNRLSSGKGFPITLSITRCIQFNSFSI